MTHSSPTSRSPSSLDSGSWFVSAAFWITLFGVAAIYAAVALSPKLAVHLELRRRFVENQGRLVDLERRNEYLERVVEALASDPGFASELARADLDAARPDEERIPVDAAHHLELHAPSERWPAPRPAWYVPLVHRLAEDDELRSLLLWACAGAAVAAFAVLHDANGPLLSRLTGTIAAVAGRLRRRYGSHRP